jgi:hypothetical protein
LGRIIILFNLGPAASIPLVSNGRDLNFADRLPICAVVELEAKMADEMKRVKQPRANAD